MSGEDEPGKKRPLPIAIMVVIGFALWVGAGALCYWLARSLT